MADNCNGKRIQLCVVLLTGETASGLYWHLTQRLEKHRKVQVEFVIDHIGQKVSEEGRERSGGVRLGTEGNSYSSNVSDVVSQCLIISKG